jgi:hypothetical protein
MEKNKLLNKTKIILNFIYFIYLFNYFFLIRQ